MTTFPQIRVLHVSDLHFGRKHVCGPLDPTGSIAGLPTLAELVRKDLQSDEWNNFVWALPPSKDLPTARDTESAPLIVAATGDLTETASRDEFDKAKEFLAELIREPILGSRIGLEQLFVVPGNHDVAFDRPKPEHRFPAYCDFYNRLFKAIQPEKRVFARPEEATALSKVHAFPQSNFLVAEINSCFHVERETIDESRGQVDAATIASLRKELDHYGQEATQWIKIALVHHHPVLLPSFVEPGRGVDSILNAKSLLRLLRENGFQLVLHGHKHLPQVFSYDPDSAWATAEASIPQMIVAAGSLGSRELPEGREKCNTYNMITVKWNPSALQARVQVVTRGLKRIHDEGELDADQWHWKTLRVFDKTLSPYENLPLPRSFKRSSPPSKEDPKEKMRLEEYGKLRHNMLVVEVLLSLLPGQGYEARVWLAPHRQRQDTPKRVTWSAGPKFQQKICEAEAGPEFCASFHYWGPMLIQAHIEFETGEAVVGYVYARLPDATTRR